MRKSETRANHVADAKRSSTHDLMMGRFLPAAKALTLDTPLVRKPTKPEEQARQMTKNVVAVKEKQNKTEQNPYWFRHSPDQQEEDWSTSDMMASGVCGSSSDLVEKLFWTIESGSICEIEGTESCFCSLYAF